MFPNFPPLPREVVSRRDGWTIAISVTAAVLATLATGFLIGALS